MKLVVAGATGTVGTEVIKQALSLPQITSIVVIARRPLSFPEGVDSSKLTTVLQDNLDHYDEEAKKYLANADACIWSVVTL